MATDHAEIKLQWIELGANNAWEAIKRASEIVEEVLPELLRTRTLRVDATLQNPDPDLRRPSGLDVDRRPPGRDARIENAALPRGVGLVLRRTKRYPRRLARAAELQRLNLGQENPRPRRPRALARRRRRAVIITILARAIAGGRASGGLVPPPRHVDVHDTSRPPANCRLHPLLAF